MSDRRVVENAVYELKPNSSCIDCCRELADPIHGLDDCLSSITRVSDGAGRRQFTPLRAMIRTSTAAQLCAVVSAQQRAWQHE